MPLKLSESIQIKSHYSNHVTEGVRAFLFSEVDSYVLNGKVFSTLIPLIAHQSMNILDIITKTINEVSPEYILYSIELLAKNNLLTTKKSNKGTENTFWSLKKSIDDSTAINQSQAITPSVDKINSLNDAVIDVISFGLPDNSGKQLKTALKRLGVNTNSNEKPNITIIIANDYLNQQLEDKIKDLDAEDKNWFLVKPTGSEIWLGPFSTNDNVCWDCVTTRLLDNRLGQHTFSEDIREASIPPLALFEPQFESALKITASFIAQYLLNIPKNNFNAYIHVLKTDTLELSKHYLLSNPGCMCAKPIPQSFKFDTESDKSYTHHENSYRISSTRETYSKIEKLVSPLTGLIPELCRSDQYDSTYIYYARHGFTISQELASNRVAGRPSWSCGKGSTDTDARVSCVAEAIERYSAGYFGNERTINARFEELPNAMHPDNVLLFSDDQYNNRESINDSFNDFHWIPERFDSTQSIDWVELTSLGNTENIFLPARYCYLNYPDENDNLFCKADSNGCATGNTVEEATLFAFYELIERDSISIWWFNELLACKVDIKSFNDYTINSISNALDDEDRTLIVIDVTSDIGIHTFAAISWQNTKNDKIYIGYGTHLDPLIAIKRSLNEVMQVASSIKENATINNKAFNHWLYDISLNDLPFLKGNDITKTKSDYNNMTTGDVSSDLQCCVKRLSDCELNLYCLNLTRGDDFLSTVRAIVPGLRHFWPRLAPGRLYDVPVKIGVSAQAKPEDQLNTIHYPL